MPFSKQAQITLRNRPWHSPVARSWRLVTMYSISWSWLPNKINRYSSQGYFSPTRSQLLAPLLERALIFVKIAHSPKGSSWSTRQIQSWKVRSARKIWMILRYWLKGILRRGEKRWFRPILPRILPSKKARNKESLINRMLI